MTLTLTSEWQRLVPAALIAVLWLVWVWRIVRAPRVAAAVRGEAGKELRPVLVAFASQTGVATALARRSAERLRKLGLAVRLESLGRLELEDLHGARRALFLVSTCGEGDAPDEAFGFVRRMSLAGARLEQLDFAVLALGDRKYPNFCAFGRRLEAWLIERGARPLVERIEVDGFDRGALGRWDGALPELGGAPGDGRDQGNQGDRRDRTPGGAALPDELTVPGDAFTTWRLSARKVMNPGSRGEPVLHLGLEPVLEPDGATMALPHWQAGDLVQIEVPGEAPALRDYSIASHPAEGRIDLFVRLQRGPEGLLGVGSRFLAGDLAAAGPESLEDSESSEGRERAAGLALGDTLRLRLRENPGFRLAVTDDAPLILIGTGSGLAGLFGLIKARERAGAGPNWLFFGERQRAHDFLCRDQIERWQASGILERFDGVFSRDGKQPRYVQHCLLECAGEVRDWVARGASIHVCGSRARLGSHVDDALAQILGDEAFAKLRESGLYRRDVW